MCLLLRETLCLGETYFSEGEITGKREIQGEIIFMKMSILKKQCEGMQGCTKLIKHAIQYRAPPNILGMATGAEPAHI